MNRFIHICILTILCLTIVTGAGCEKTDTTLNSTPLNPGATSDSNSTPIMRSTSLSSVEHGCDWSKTLPESRPSDFNLIFKYGYSIVSKNELNTFDGTYTKDLAPPVTIDLNLSNAEMDRIYQKMLDIDFFCYPNTFEILIPAGGMVARISNYQGYYFQVVCDQRIKILRWDDTIQNADEDATNLRSLISLIRNIVESKNEYRKLPATGPIS